MNLRENCRLLGQRWSLVFLLTSKAVARILILLHHFSEPQFPQKGAERGRWSLCLQCIALWKRNPELRESESFIIDRIACPSIRELLSLLYWTVNMPVLCSRGKHYLHLPKLFTVQTTLKEQFRKKRASVPLLTRHVETQETHGELPPHNSYIYIHCNYIVISMTFYLLSSSHIRLLFPWGCGLCSFCSLLYTWYKSLSGKWTKLYWVNTVFNK